MTIIVPAHNEQMHLAACLDSLRKATFQGKKQIIVVDDGSKDSTFKIAKKYEELGIKIIQTPHIGKAAAINTALAQAKGEVIAIVDADSTIEENAFIEILRELGKKNAGAACSVVKVANRGQFFPMWSHLEQLYNSLMRSILSKINANITTPGPLSVYRADALKKIGGFSTKGFSEDVDVTIRLIRAGYRIKFSDKAVAYTIIPPDIKGFFRQRFRFARGMLNIFKRHLQINKTTIDLYTLPLLTFFYVQAIIMGSITLYNILKGYFAYFVAHGVYFNWAVAKFFFEWFSIIGFFKWTYSVLITHTAPLTMLSIVAIVSTMLSYPLLLYSIIKYDRKIDLWHLIPFMFMFPFWLMIMVLYMICLPELFVKNQYNRWKKNE